MPTAVQDGPRVALLRFGCALPVVAHLPAPDLRGSRDGEMGRRGNEWTHVVIPRAGDEVVIFGAKCEFGDGVRGWLGQLHVLHGVVGRARHEGGLLSEHCALACAGKYAQTSVTAHGHLGYPI